MTKSLFRFAIAVGVGLLVMGCVELWAQPRPPRPGGGPPRGRALTATESAPVALVDASVSAGTCLATLTVENGIRVIESNGIPDHEVGPFPNRGNPNRLASRTYRFEVTTTPQHLGRPTYARRQVWGVAVNGIPFDPGTAEFWHGDPRSGWNYDALGGAVPLGLDANHAHVQPTGAYHYHGLPMGLIEELGWRPGSHSPLIGWAADGFPVYAVTGDLGRGATEVRSSYRLKSGDRPGRREPTGDHDGAFVQDWEYAAGSGDLDECNGAVTYSPEFPDGTYAYFLTEEYPFVGRCWMGTPDASFAVKRERPRGGRP